MNANHSDVASVPEPPLPPTVEGRIPDASELAAKAANGRYYLNDVWKIVREFPTADNYECGIDLLGLAPAVAPAVHASGFLTLDSSARLDKLHHALHLAEAWASLVREARTSNVMHILRRTPQNCGAMLMVQRQEHIRGYVNEITPIALIVVCKDDQLLLTREQVPEHNALCRMLLGMATGSSVSDGRQSIYDEVIEELGELTVNAEGNMRNAAGFKDAINWCGESPNMPDALFKQQMHAVRLMMDAMGVPPPPSISGTIRDNDDEELGTEENTSDIDENSTENACVDVGVM